MHKNFVVQGWPAVELEHNYNMLTNYTIEFQFFGVHLHFIFRLHLQNGSTEATKFISRLTFCIHLLVLPFCYDLYKHIQFLDIVTPCNYSKKLT